MKVERIFSRDPVAISRYDSVRAAAHAMRHFHVGALLVMEGRGLESEVVGIVTDRDLVLHSLGDGVANDAAVDRVMTPVVASVPADADVMEALERMRAAGVRRLLVTDAGGDPAGIVSLDDIVDGLAAELASAAALLRNEVRREVAELGDGRVTA